MGNIPGAPSVVRFYPRADVQVSDWFLIGIGLAWYPLFLCLRIQLTSRACSYDPKSPQNCV